MSAIARMMDEHRKIEQALDRLEAFADSLVPGDESQKETLAGFVSFFSGYADEIHHGKEEKLLFAAMADHGFPQDEGAVAVMLAEHVQGRELIAVMRNAAQTAGPLDAAATEDVRTAMRNYADMLRAHIEKEDTILYVMAESSLPDEARRELDFACAEHDETRAEEISRLLDLADRLGRT